MATGLIRQVRQVKTCEAGVDLAFNDEPQGWLAEEPSAVEAPVPAVREVAEPPPQPKIGGDPAAWPADLVAFQRWWLEDPDLDANGANTTAAAAVLAVEKHVAPAGATALVLGGTGPVGQRVGRLLARATVLSVVLTALYVANYVYGWITPEMLMGLG